jgi:very-short-patch-repair endonuclease
MQYNYNKNLTGNARALRKNMTPEENHLWYDFLKRLPITVNRQKNIGDYIVDFYIARARLVIEIDGRQHRLPEHRKEDEKRDFELFKLGNRVLRYSNEDIRKRFSGVCDEILRYCGLSADELKPAK